MLVVERQEGGKESVEGGEWVGGGEEGEWEGEKGEEGEGTRFLLIHGAVPFFCSFERFGFDTY